MPSYTPAVLLATYPTTAELIALYGSEGISTGFGCYNAAGSPSIFSSPTNFFNKLLDEGFFTGSNPRLYYNPAQVAALLAQPNVTFNSYSINLVEYRMRVEGISTGCLTPAGTAHAPGEDDCTILAALSNEGFTTGAYDVANQADAALSDYHCLDGRQFNTECVALWHAFRTDGPSIASLTNLTEDVSKRVTVTFGEPVTLWCGVWTSGGASAPGNAGAITVDDVYVCGNNNADASMTRFALKDVAAGTHTIKFYVSSLKRTSECDYVVFAFRQGG